MKKTQQTPPMLEWKRTTERDVSPWGTAVHIACRLLDDTARYIIGSELHDMEVRHKETRGETGQSNISHFSLNFQTDKKLMQFIDAINEINILAFRQSLLSKSMPVLREGNVFKISTSNLNDIATLVEFIMGANERPATKLSPIETVSDLADSARTNLRFMWAQLPLPAANLIKSYNANVAKSDAAPLQDFLFLPNDLRRAGNAYRKVTHDIKELPSAQILYIN